MKREVKGDDLWKASRSNPSCSEVPELMLYGWLVGCFAIAVAQSEAKPHCSFSCLLLCRHCYSSHCCQSSVLFDLLKAAALCCACLDVGLVSAPAAMFMPAAFPRCEVPGRWMIGECFLSLFLRALL